MIDEKEDKLLYLERKLKHVSPSEVDGILKDILYVLGIPK